MKFSIRDLFLVTVIVVLGWSVASSHLADEVRPAIHFAFSCGQR